LGTVLEILSQKKRDNNTSTVKTLLAMQEGDAGLIPGSGSSSGGRNGYPFQ